MADGDAGRFYILVRWFRTVGTCSTCAMDGAIAMVEREAGRTWDPKDDLPCTKTDRRGRTCRQLAELHWTERPKRPARASVAVPTVKAAAAKG